MTAFLRAMCLAALLSSVTGTAAAQLISVRTVPIARGDQFETFPSASQGMAGVSIALADTLADMAVNPAKGARLPGAFLFTAPVLYSVSGNTGGGRALPVGAVGRAGSWFGGFSVALQSVDPGRPGFGPVAVAEPLSLDVVPGGTVTLPADSGRSHGNAFGFAVLGRTWPGTGLSLGGSVLLSRRTAVDGVDLLYAGSRDVEQFGEVSDFRLGLLKEWTGSQALEVLVLHHRFRMTHDVLFVDQRWDPNTQQTFLRPRFEQNRDDARTWGLHLVYQHPLGESGWRLGWLATANRVQQSRVPAYEISGGGIETLPWDPGTANAFNLGVGIARPSTLARVGLDLIYEPIWSRTWSEAAVATTTRLGETIPVGGRTADNEFRFSNLLARIGVDRELPLGGPRTTIGMQFGLALRWMHLWLGQFDNVQVAGRNHEEEWLEWTPTWGLGLRFPEWTLRYQGRATQGTRRPGAVSGGNCCVLDLARAESVAPWPGPQPFMGDVSIVTHQVYLSIPLGRLAAPGGER